MLNNCTILLMFVVFFFFLLLIIVSSCYYDLVLIQEGKKNFDKVSTILLEQILFKIVHTSMMNFFYFQYIFFFFFIFQFGLFYFQRKVCTCEFHVVFICFCLYSSRSHSFSCLQVATIAFALNRLNQYMKKKELERTERIK